MRAEGSGGAGSAAAPASPEEPLPVWRLRLAYHGGAYHGWQIQPNARTIQGELVRRLQGVLGLPDLRVAGTSRTDAGVHALDQHVSFAARLPGTLTPERLQTILNRQLPGDIRVLDLKPAPPGFHARFSAWGKAYTYMICRTPICSPFLSGTVWHIPESLDLAAMERAAAHLRGVHDFATFSSNPHRPLESTVREVLDCRIVDGGSWLAISVAGRAFLYRMVRTLAGFLVAVGRGRCDAAETPALLEAADRTRLRADAAPADGLFLARVFFSEAEYRQYRPVLPPLGAEMFRIGSG